jgi:hypothetical protein
MVGAFARLPASDEMATREKLPRVPIIAAAVACQKEIPKPRKNDPYESAKNETLAAAHGQNKDLAEPLRSDSEIKLIPFTSMLFEIFAIGSEFN